MKRRDFLKSILASLALPGSTLASVSGRASNGEALSCVFYDERFQAAEPLARKLAGSGEVVPVRGDVTQLWNGRLKSASQRMPLMLAGVTTESFYFCLKTLMHSHRGLDLTSRRIDRDLIAWSVRTHQANSLGVARA